MARARRILPALIVLCAVLMVLGWWLLLPIDYRLLGNHVAFSTSFLSNIAFWNEAGYFDSASHEKWLLHTWSLAVEWQFYLLLPLLLVAVWKWRPGRHALTVAIAALLLASLAASIIVTPLYPSAAFYLLPMRAWEMLAGGLVFLHAPQLRLGIRQQTVLETAGLLLVIAALLSFDAATSWPGWRALVPVTGTMMVVLAARNPSLWTGNRAAQWLGTRSYSLYLWHWPVVVALTYMGLQKTPLFIGGGLVLTLLFGHVSYVLVEAPARIHLNKLSMRWSAVLLLATALIVIAAGAAVQWQEGVYSRMAPAIEAISDEGMNKNERLVECHPETGTTSPSCVYGGEHLGAIVTGDSHANALISAVVAAMPEGEGAMEWSYSSCPTLQGVHRLGEKTQPCTAFIDWMLQQLKMAPKGVPLIIINRTTFYAEGFNEPWEPNANTHTPLVYFNKVYKSDSPAFMAEFTQKMVETTCKLAQDRPVYLMRPIPEMGVDVPKATSRAMLWGSHRDVSVSLEEYHRRHKAVWAAQDAVHARCGVKILDPIPYLCPDGVCHGSKDGRPLYFDDDHLSEYGNKLLVPMFAEVFRK
jgi:peptidoglycan/LPS O-acetylase OafA/YrhL